MKRTEIPPLPAGSRPPFQTIARSSPCTGQFSLMRYARIYGPKYTIKNGAIRRERSQSKSTFNFFAENSRLRLQRI